MKRFLYLLLITSRITHASDTTIKSPEIEKLHQEFPDLIAALRQIEAKAKLNAQLPKQWQPTPDAKPAPDSSDDENADYSRDKKITWAAS